MSPPQHPRPSHRGQLTCTEPGPPLWAGVTGIEAVRAPGWSQDRAVSGDGLEDGGYLPPPIRMGPRSSLSPRSVCMGKLKPDVRCRDSLTLPSCSWDPPHSPGSCWVFSSIAPQRPAKSCGCREGGRGMLRAPLCIINHISPYPFPWSCSCQELRVQCCNRI